MNTPLMLSALQGNVTSAPPFWFMRQAGRYLPEYLQVRASTTGFMDLCFTPEKAAEVTLQPIRRFNMDAAILFSDILVIPHALGQNVTFVKGEGPKLNAVSSHAEIEALQYDATKLDNIYETLKLVKKGLTDDKTLIGFSGSPWTLACYMIEGSGSKDFAKVRRFGHENPESFALLFDKIESAMLDYIGKQIAAGAQVIQLFDSWSGILSAYEFDEWVIAPTKRIVAKLRAKYPHIPIIGFPRLSGIGYRRFVKETGVQAISIDPQITPAWAKSHLSEFATIQGNLDSLLLASNGDAALDAAKRLVEAYQDVAYIFNLGHGFLPYTPVKNVEKLVNYLHSLR